MQATIEFLCGECHEKMTFSAALALGENRLNFTCMQCGEHWQAHFVIISFEPWQVMNFEIKRLLGVLQDGIFYAKEQLQ